MKKNEFNRDWICRRLSDGKEEQVTLPHDAMIREERTIHSKGIHNIGWFEGKDYVYSKNFFLPKEYETKVIKFEVEGAYHNAEVFLNGIKAAYHPYGYSDFFVDTKHMLKYGEDNKIEIYTYNSDQPNSRWYTGTGLYRPVNMYISDAEHILVNGVKIRTVSHDPAVIEVDVQTTGDGEITIEIMEQEQVIASEKTYIVGMHTLVKIELQDAKLWNVDSPNMYQCRVKFKTDEVVEDFGIRTLQWDGEHGISINGERVILRGACIHHDNGVLGACAYPEAEERKVRILKENGYNAIRSAHNPCSKAILSACDQLGMLMMDEYVDVWYIHKTEHDYADQMESRWKTDLKEMVEKDYNHPCVIMYSTGNEVAETAQERGIELTGSMTQYLHELDTTRPVSCGINIFFNFLSSIGLGVYSDEKAKKETDATKKPVGSEFYNTLAGMFGDYTMKVGATLYPCDVKTRDAYANMDIAGYNYGIFRYKHDLRKYPNRLILGSETFCKDAYLFWEQAKNNPRLVGDFVWAGMDYIGEAGIGAWEYEDYAPANAKKEGWLTAGSGRIDILGNPNGEALYTKVAFEQTEDIYIAVKPVYQTGKHSPSAWKMTDAIPSWTYPGCEGQLAKIEVYARAYEVELLLNGKTIGRKKLKNRCVVYFTAKYLAGELVARSYDEEGNVLKSTSLSTATTETRLSIFPEKEKADKDSLIYLPMCYTDHSGIWKPMEKHELKIQVKNGVLKGFGNACSYNPEGYQKNHTKTYYGRALAVVQATGEGPVQISVTDESENYSVQIDQ